MNEEFLEIANRISARRKEMGLTQEQVAFSSGVNRRVVGELERGKATVRVDVLLRVAESLALNIRVEPRT